MSEATSSSRADNNLAESPDAATRDGHRPVTSQATSNSQIDNGKPSDDGANRSQHTNQSEAELIAEMQNFDNLLKMLSVYRDNPDLRGNPNDRHIEEIAKVLSTFIGDDPDNFLKDSDEEEDEPVRVNGQVDEETNCVPKQQTPFADENDISSNSR